MMDYLISQAPKPSDWAGMPTEEIHSQIEQQTGEALKSNLDLFPYLDLVNFEGETPYSETQKQELIKETLSMAQKISAEKQTLYESLRGFDVKYPKGIVKTNLKAIAEMVASIPV